VRVVAGAGECGEWDDSYVSWTWNAACKGDECRTAFIIEIFLCKDHGAKEGDGQESEGFNGGHLGSRRDSLC
jgi:hypothetical protein